MSRARRRIWGAAAIALGLAAIALAIAGRDPAAAAPDPADATSEAAGGTAVAAGPAATAGGDLVAQGRRLFEQGCSDCHGLDAHGLEGIAPDLHGVGALSADFYLRTGRMPLDDPTDQPVRSHPTYSEAKIDALVAYVGSLGGPPIPNVDISDADIANGQVLFTENCAGCHQVVGQGGILPGAVAPSFHETEPIDVAEALTVGPYIMPTFRRLTSAEVNDLAAFVTYTRDPEDPGGLGIGNTGPIPEGMVAWLLAGAALLIAIRLIGERTTR